MSHVADTIEQNLKNVLDKAEPSETTDCCIYRVPFVLRTLNQDAYTPKFVSIGPFHHPGHNDRLKNMEQHKLISFKAFLQRTNTTLHTFIHYIQSIQTNFKSCYSEKIKIDSDELVKIILIDSGFIIELFLRSFYDNRDEGGSYPLKPWLASNISLDLLLLENQLPFFVLQNIFNLAFHSSTHAIANIKNSPSFLELTYHYFGEYNKSKLPCNERIRHFTDLIRIFHLQHPPERRARRMHEPKHLPSVTEMREAGVRFRVNTKSECLLDLRFSGRVLEIPELKVKDWTEVLFRNMVALEQCHYPFDSFITDYVAVLNLLINTSKDVDILVKKSILVNWLSDSDSVANLFNSICQNVTHFNSSSHYSELCDQLNGFCNDRWHKWKATLKRDYCSSPWQTAASIAGILLLILSLLQSVCSVLQIVQ